MIATDTERDAVLALLSQYVPTVLLAHDTAGTEPTA